MAGKGTNRLGSVRGWGGGRGGPFTRAWMRNPVLLVGANQKKGRRGHRHQAGSKPNVTQAACPGHPGGAWPARASCWEMPSPPWAQGGCGRSAVSSTPSRPPSCAEWPERPAGRELRGRAAEVAAGAAGVTTAAPVLGQTSAPPWSPLQSPAGRAAMLLLSVALGWCWARRRLRSLGGGGGGGG